MTKTLATLQQLLDFDVKKISFGPIKKPDASAKAGPASARPSRIPLRYDGEILKVQTGTMYLPFHHEADANNTSMTFCTKVNDMSDAQRVYAEAIIKVLKDVQDECEKKALENSMEWFGKSKAAFQEASDSFTKPLKEHAENRYPPHLKVKYYRDDQNLPQFPVYDGNTMQPLHTRQAPNTKFNTAETFAINTRHVAIIDCSGIWSLNKRGGLTWRLNDVLSYAAVQSFPFKNIESVSADDTWRNPSISESDFEVTASVPYKDAEVMDEEENVDIAA